jgi:tetratricopeptide (TPR) repeat protein
MNSKHQAKLVAIHPFQTIGLAAALAFLFSALPVSAQNPPPGGATPTMRNVVRPAPAAMTIDEALAFTKKSPKDTNSWLALGAAYRRAHRYDEAAAAFKKMTVVDANNSTGWVSLGAVYMDMRKSADAKAAFQRALKINPEDAAAHYNMGTYYMTIGKRDDALGEFKRASAAKPPIADAIVSTSL